MTNYVHALVNGVFATIILVTYRHSLVTFCWNGLQHAACYVFQCSWDKKWSGTGTSLLRYTNPMIDIGVAVCLGYLLVDLSLWLLLTVYVPDVGSPDRVKKCDASWSAVKKFIGIAFSWPPGINHLVHLLARAMHAARDADDFDYFLFHFGILLAFSCYLLNGFGGAVCVVGMSTSIVVENNR